MSSMALTETQIRHLKPKDKRYMIRDDNGLYLEVMTSGNMHWRYRYYDGKKEIKRHNKIKTGFSFS